MGNLPELARWARCHMLTTTILFLTTLAAPKSQVPELPLLSPVFGDHMVLQRERANPIWGWDKPGTAVTVSSGGKTARATAGKDGKWMASLPALPTGGPYTLSVQGTSKRVLQDVLVGDVWVCSGQSNMEQGVGISRDPQKEIAAANYPNIRLTIIPHNVQFAPVPTAPAEWSVCTPENIAKSGWSGFSAVAYFFGRELNQRLKVPIGLIQSCWGGTIIEAWASRPSVARQGDFAAALSQIDQATRSGVTPYHQQVDSWASRVDAGSKTGANWHLPTFDASAWQAAKAPYTYETNGLGAFDGVVWFRIEVEVPSGALGEAKLSLGSIDDFDATWVNGTRVGATFQYDAPRNYGVPEGTLKPGKNVIVVRAIDTGGPGGFMSPAGDMVLQLANGTKIPLGSGSWKYAQGAPANSRPAIPQPMSGNPNVPTVLYNGMIAPLQPMAIKGAIWYQGESNAGRAYQYRELMPMLIADWRRGFQNPRMPFFIVQLANFTQRLPNPGESDWAELREAQAMAAADDSRVGLATAIDIGEANDIHPKNKQDVGFRLALSALKIAYGQNVVHSGPTYSSMKVAGNKVLLSFENVAEGLQDSGGTLPGFSVSGADRKFVWAEAKIVGKNQVEVSSPLVPQPVAVRYGWANNPEVGLWNSAKLPAVPFRTDAWPGITLGKK